MHSLSTVMRELLTLLTMSSESSSALEDMLVEDDRQELCESGNTLREGLISTLEDLESLGLVTHDWVDDSPGVKTEVWRLTPEGRKVGQILINR